VRRAPCRRSTPGSPPRSARRTWQKTLDALSAAQDGSDAAREAAAEAARRTIVDADQRLARHRAAIEAGTDPAQVARWTAEVNAERVLAENQLRRVRPGAPG
jgi:site-specific DNA recombinase